MNRLIVEREGDSYFTGNLEQGIALAKRDRYPVLRTTEGLWQVYLLDRPHSESEAEAALSKNMWPEDTAEWGCAPTEEDAWRFALGAMFGPFDSEYNEPQLHAWLQIAPYIGAQS